MKFLLNLCDITGAIVSSKMTGDIRAHAGWTLRLFIVLTILAYFVVRP